MLFFWHVFQRNKAFLKAKIRSPFFRVQLLRFSGAFGECRWKSAVLRPAQTPKMWEQTQVGTSLEGVWDMKNYHGNDWLTANGRNAKFVLRIHPQKVAPPIEKLGLVIHWKNKQPAKGWDFSVATSLPVGLLFVRLGFLDIPSRHDFWKTIKPQLKPLSNIISCHKIRISEQGVVW